MRLSTIDWKHNTIRTMHIHRENIPKPLNRNWSSLKQTGFEECPIDPCQSDLTYMSIAESFE